MPASRACGQKLGRSIIEHVSLSLGWADGLKRILLSHCWSPSFSTENKDEYAVVTLLVPQKGTGPTFPDARITMAMRQKDMLKIGVNILNVFRGENPAFTTKISTHQNKQSSGPIHDKYEARDDDGASAEVVEQI